MKPENKNISYTAIVMWCFMILTLVCLFLLKDETEHLFLAQVIILLFASMTLGCCCSLLHPNIRDFLVERIENEQKTLSKMKQEYLEELFQEEFKFRSMFQQDAQNHGADTSADELYRYADLAAKESCRDMQRDIDTQQEKVNTLERQLVEMDAKIEISKKLPSAM